MLAAGHAVYSELKNLIVWAKDNGGMGSFYRSRHELVFAFKNGKAPHINNFGLGQKGRYRTNVWEYRGINSVMGGVMTYSPSENAELLLEPEQLLAAAEILNDRSLLPELPGIYAWWFRTAPFGVPLEGCNRSDDFTLLYVGIAPRAPSRAGGVSRSTLRSRIGRNHLGNRIAASTLRRSLAALLADQLHLEIGINEAGKKVMRRADEAALTVWLAENAALSFMVDEKPWLIEDQLIVSGPALPLNIKGSSHPFRAELSLRRSTAGLHLDERVVASERSAPGLDLFRHRSATENTRDPLGRPAKWTPACLRAGLRQCSETRCSHDGARS